MLLQLLLGVTWTLQDYVHTREIEKSHWHVGKELTLRLLELMEVPFEKTQEKLLCHTSLFRSGCLSRSVALDGLSVVSWWDWSLENFVWRNTDQWVPCAHSSPLCCWPGQGFGSNCTWWHWLQVVLQNKLWYFVHNPILISGLNMTASWKSVIEVIDLVTKMVNVQTDMLHTGSIKYTSTLSSEILRLETMALMIWQWSLLTEWSDWPTQSSQSVFLHQVKYRGCFPRKICLLLVGENWAPLPRDLMCYNSYRLDFKVSFELINSKRNNYRQR